MHLQQLPGLLVGFRPVLAEDAATNLSILRYLKQTLLHGDANVAALTGRAVAVDQLQQLSLFLARDGEFALEALQGFVHLWHVGFEVDGFDGADLGLSLLRPCVRGLQIADQTLKRFLIRVVVFPVAEVGDEILKNLAGGIFAGVGVEALPVAQAVV